MPLNDAGLQQAKLIAERLKDEDFGAIYSSDLKRAVHTAEKIAAYHQIPVLTTPKMRELHFGIWEGYTFDKMVKEWPEEVERWRRSPFDVSPPEGETLEQLQSRTSDFLQKTAKKHPAEKVLVVSHGGTLRAILATLLNLKGDLYWKFKIGNTSITTIEYDGKAHLAQSDAFIISVNDTGHIKKESRGS